MGKNCVYKGQKMILFYIGNSYNFAFKITKNSYISCKNNPIFLLYFGKDLVDSLQLASSGIILNHCFIYKYIQV